MGDGNNVAVVTVYLLSIAWRNVIVGEFHDWCDVIGAVVVL